MRSIVALGRGVGARYGRFMLSIRPLNDRFAVAPQVDPADLAAVKAAGYVVVINNRPDGEEPGQPDGDTMRAAARALGLGYHTIPVGQVGIGHDQLDATIAALTAADGPVLAYCRSGTRSCHLWALAAAKSGRAPHLLVEQADAAGYDLTALRPTLEALAQERMA